MALKAWLAGWLAGWLALSPDWLGLRLAWLALGGSSREGTDVRTDGRTYRGKISHSIGFRPPLSGPLPNKKTKRVLTSCEVDGVTRKPCLGQ